jgi:Fe-Mn family superoxide dismutase
MSIQLPPLPYPLNALEPHLSQRTLEHHYQKHHKKYVDTLNELIEQTRYAEMNLEEIIFETVGREGREKKIFNNAAQIWNHTFYWSCMTPSEDEKPSAAFKKALETYFGSFEDFLGEYKKTAKELFGSGWVWLVKTETGELKLRGMENAGTPITDGQIPLMVCDVWEHAYYLDYQQKRDEYFEQFTQVIHWSFVESNFRKENPGFVLNTKQKPKDSRFSSHH